MGADDQPHRAAQGYSGREVFLITLGLGCLAGAIVCGTVAAFNHEPLWAIAAACFAWVATATTK